MSDHGHTDVAALGAGVVAVAVTMLVDDGPFDLAGAIVALTLLLVNVAYVWPNPRSRRSLSAAISAVLATVSIPIVGFLLELWLSAKPVLEHFSKWSDQGDDTAVGPALIATGWVVICGVLYWVDRQRHKKALAQA